MDSKSARESDCGIVFLDEVGRGLASLVRRTWVRWGWTLVMCCQNCHDRLSMTVILGLSARRRRIGLCFEVGQKNVRGEDTETFSR